MESLKIKMPQTSAINFAKPIGGFINDITGASALNDFNASEAQKQRAWEESMSNTAYQRAVKDMKEAGLNPYLIYNGASPATTPSGGVAQASSGSNATQSIVNSAFNLVGKISDNKVKRENNIISALKLLTYIIK